VFNLTVQGTALSGAGQFTWTSVESLSVSGTFDGPRVHLTLQRLNGPAAGDAMQFDGLLVEASRMHGVFQPDATTNPVDKRTGDFIRDAQ
jgi:hypothetical protein